jgi:hypothetical protein
MSAAIEMLNRDPDLREAIQSFWLAADKADEELVAKCQEVLGITALTRQVQGCESGVENEIRNIRERANTILNAYRDSLKQHAELITTLQTEIQALKQQVATTNVTSNSTSKREQAQQPDAEMQERFLQAAEISRLQHRWKHATGHMPSERQFQIWLSEYSVQQIHSAFEKMVNKHQDSAMEPTHQTNYVNCVLRGT